LSICLACRWLLDSHTAHPSAQPSQQWLRDHMI
jgi:hypothetical protein